MLEISLNSVKDDASPNVMDEKGNIIITTTTFRIASFARITFIILVIAIAKKEDEEYDEDEVFISVFPPSTIEYSPYRAVPVGTNRM